MSDVWDFYMKTQVEISDGEKTWNIQAADKPEGEWPFVEEGLIILTAANPRSQNLPAQENQKRNKDLKGLLDRLGTTVYSARGYDPKSKWSEDGFAVNLIHQEKLFDVCRRYGQNAIYRIKPNSFECIGVLLPKYQQAPLKIT
jgi:hypothetical protein